MDDQKTPQWHVARGGVRKGPYSFAQLKAAAGNGSLRATDLVFRPGATAETPAEKIAGLFPAAEAPLASAPAAPREGPAALNLLPEPMDKAPSLRRRGFWWAIAGGAVCLVVAIVVLLARGETAPTPVAAASSPRDARDFRDAPTAAAAREMQPPPKDAAELAARIREHAKAARESRPGGTRRRQDSAPDPAPRYAAPSAPTSGAVAFETVDLELPPVGPAQPDPVDRVAADFKAARAAYPAARGRARGALAAAFRTAYAERVKRVNPAAMRGDKEFERFAREHAEFDRSGTLPTDPELLGAVARYWEAADDAARRFGAAGEAGLAAYAKAGVDDPVLLNPLRAAREAGRHAKLLGVWTGPSKRFIVSAGNIHAWVIDFDERTGGLQVADIEWHPGAGSLLAVYRGQQVEVKGGALSFVAKQVHETPAPSEGIRTTLTPDGDRLRLEMIGVPQPGGSLPAAPPAAGMPFGRQPWGNPPFGSPPFGSLPFGSPPFGRFRLETPPQGAARGEKAPAREVQNLVVALDRTDHPRSREHLDYRLKECGDPGLTHKPEAPTAPAVVLNDANAVWRRLAWLTSFSYFPDEGREPLRHEALYLPYKSRRMSVARGPYGELADMLAGQAPGATQNESRTQSLLRDFETLARAEHPYLRRAAERGMAICRARLQLARADEEFGNTPAASVREFQQKLFIPAVQYAFLREADRAELQESLERANPGWVISVAEAPLSLESRQKLKEVLDGAGDLGEDVTRRAVVSGLLAYADMAQVDRAAAYWRTWLLPLARRAAGPPAAKPLTQVHGGWRPGKGGGRGQPERLCIDHFGLTNVAGQDLTNVVVELVAANPWGEQAAHYYYIPRIEVGGRFRLAPHPRWDRRRLEFTNSLTATWSVWADQGTETSRRVEIAAPIPNPDPEPLRRALLADDARYQAVGEAFGAAVRRMFPLPVSPEHAQRLLAERTAPGTRYVFRLPVEGESARTLVLRFVRADLAQGVFEAEIFDARTRQPFQADIAVWKGTLARRGQPSIVFAGDDGRRAGWSFTQVDDQPEIVCPTAGQPGSLFPVRSVPLFLMKGP